MRAPARLAAVRGREAQAAAAAERLALPRRLDLGTEAGERVPEDVARTNERGLQERARGGSGARSRRRGRAALGRGGGLRFAASRRRKSGPVLALNGDELLDLDYTALVAQHLESGAAATIVVAQVRSPFGVVDRRDDGRSPAFARPDARRTGSTRACTSLARRRSRDYLSAATTSSPPSPSSPPRANCAPTGTPASG